MPDKVLFWDIDGTIVRNSLEGLFVQELRRWKQDYNMGRILTHAISLSFDANMKWYRLKLAYLRGQSVREIDIWLDSWFEESVKKQIYPEIEKAIRSLSGSGRRQVLLSGTPSFLAKRLGNILGIENIIAADPEIHSGYYTGRLLSPHPYGPEKVSRAAYWLNANSLNWSKTIGLANHWSDRFLMEHVEIPIPVNPDKRMEKLALERGWDMIPDATKFKGFEKILSTLHAH